MSANLFDAGDIQRLDREATLTEEAPRQLPQEDRSPNEEFLDIQDEPQGDNDIFFDGLLAALRRRLV